MVFLALAIAALCVAVPTHRMLHTNVFLTSVVVSSGLLITGFIGVASACQRKEGWFIFYGVAGFFNFFALVIGGGFLMVYGGVFSESECVRACFAF